MREDKSPMLNRINEHDITVGILYATRIKVNPIFKCKFIITHTRYNSERMQ